MTMFCRVCRGNPEFVVKGFKFRPHFTTHRAAVLLAGAVLLTVLIAGESSRAMLASARLSCLLVGLLALFEMPPLFRSRGNRTRMLRSRKRVPWNLSYTALA